MCDSKHMRVLDLLPHRQPIVMVDELLHVDLASMESSFLVKDGCVFVANGTLLEGGLIENVAQTAALGVGAAAKLAGKEAPIGYIGAVSKLSVFSLPALGSRLRTMVARLHEVGPVQVIKGSVYSAEVTVAEMEMKVFITDGSHQTS